jgi:hypothetical protein
MSNADYQVDAQQTRIPRKFNDLGRYCSGLGVPLLGGFLAVSNAA